MDFHNVHEGHPVPPEIRRIGDSNDLWTGNTVPGCGLRSASYVAVNSVIPRAVQGNQRITIPPGACNFALAKGGSPV